MPYLTHKLLSVLVTSCTDVIIWCSLAFSAPSVQKILYVRHDVIVNINVKFCSLRK